MVKDIKNLKGIEIFLGYACNVNCSFCFQEELRQEYKDPLPDSYIYGLLEEGIIKGNKFVIFSGGEPTLHKNLPFFIQYARNLGYEHIRVHSNGFGFRKYEYLENLYSLGLTGVTLSLHGFGIVHDSITKVKGSFNIIQKALLHFEKLKQKDSSFVFDTNTVICRENYHFLDKVVIFLSRFSIERVMLTYPYNTNTNDTRLRKIIVKYSDLIPPLLEALEIINRKNFKNFVIESIPYCLVDKKYWPLILNNHRTKKDAFSPDGQIGSDEQYLNGKIKYPSCQKCSKVDQCYGFSHDYHILYDIPSFIPLH